MRFLLSFGFLVLFVATDVSARETGTGTEKAEVQGLSFTVFTYRPSGCSRPALLFVFHGNSRTAAKYRDYARPLADGLCLVVIAPLFDSERFPNWRYHRGGVYRNGRQRPRDDWTVNLVAGLVDWARQREGRPYATYYLFGHSAGGQFLSRVAAFAPPPNAARIVIANPSSFVMPSLDEPAPYGMGRLFDDEAAEVRLRDYLGLPITIYLGTEDTGSKSLHNHPAARRQGSNRLERGKTVFRSAQALARKKGWAFNWKLVRAPNVGHSTRRMLSSAKVLDAFGLSDVAKRQEGAGK